MEDEGFNLKEGYTDYSESHAVVSGGTILYRRPFNMSSVDAANQVFSDLDCFSRRFSELTEKIWKVKIICMAVTDEKYPQAVFQNGWVEGGILTLGCDRGLFTSA
jgi:hypothetical protein